MHMSEIAPLISDLAVILVAAGIVTLVFKWLKQPVVLGYIVAGVLAGPAITFFPTVTDTVNIKIWADIGVIFLLFAMGLEFSFKKLMNVGNTAVVAALVIVCGMMLVGYSAGNALGFSHLSSLFLGGMLAMSSTAIVYKALDDLGLREQKFAGIALGILVVEDLVAVVLMVLLSTLAVSKEVEGMEMLGSLAKLIAFLVFWGVLGIYVLPTFLKRVKRWLNAETLLVIAVGLCLGMVMLATKAGFSAALGAFVMGSLLAETAEGANIERIVQPVKDLFGAVFFVSVGMMIQPAMVWEYIGPILVLVCLVIVGQAVFGTLGVVLSGQPLKVAMQTSFSLTQVGEFAFIIASLGESLKVTDRYLYPVIVAVSVITTFLTPYMMRLALPANRFVEKHLPDGLRVLLLRYTSASATVRHKSTWQRLLRSMVLSMTVYLIFTVFFVLLFFRSIEPWILSRISGLQGEILGLAIMLVVLGPLLWGIVMTKNHSPEFRKLWRDNNKYNRGPLVAIVIVKVLIATTILVAVVTRLFNVALGIGLLIAIALLAIMIFSKKLHKRYLAIERQFLSNFNGNDKSNEVRETWLAASPFADLHLAEFTLSPNSPFVGKTLKEIGFRQLFGVNIVSLSRGDDTKNIPGGDERLCAFDKLTIVGTDAEIEAARRQLDNLTRQRENALAVCPRVNVRIDQFTVEASSPLVGLTISEVALRGRTACLIVGIQRETEALMNPASDTRFQPGDTVWVVGEPAAVLRLSVGLHVLDRRPA